MNLEKTPDHDCPDADCDRIAKIHAPKPLVLECMKWKDCSSLEEIK